MKVLIGALVGGAIVVAVVLFMNQPEPTTEERLEEAAKQAGEAAKDAVGVLKDAANEATGALAEDLSKSAEDIAGQFEIASAELSQRITSSSDEAQASMKKMMDDWKATGIMTDAGIDFDKASAALAGSDLSEEVKSQISMVLNFLNSAPDQFDARAKEVDEALNP